MGSRSIKEGLWPMWGAWVTPSQEDATSRAAVIRENAKHRGDAIRTRVGRRLVQFDGVKVEAWVVVARVRELDAAQTAAHEAAAKVCYRARLRVQNTRDHVNNLESAEAIWLLRQAEDCALRNRTEIR